MELKDLFKEYRAVAVGFSGGVDSTYLLHEAVRYADRCCAYMVRTQFQPKFELEDAKRAARDIGAELKVIEADVLDDERIASNPPDRCYWCKRRIFSLVRMAAEADGYSLLADGTNASDDVDDRPGMRAIDELKVISPLRLCGLTKPKIRELSKEAGLFTWDKPAYACLATRVPTGSRITRELLSRVEAAEAAMAEMGYIDFRVRVFHGAARIQMLPSDLERAVRSRDEIRDALLQWFDPVLIDLKAR